MLSKYEKLQKEQIRLESKIKNLENVQSMLRMRSQMFFEVSKAIKELQSELTYLKVNNQKPHKGFVKSLKGFFA